MSGLEPHQQGQLDALIRNLEQADGQVRAKALEWLSTRPTKPRHIRLFKRRIIVGNGERSEERVRALRLRLDMAINELGGLQQALTNSEEYTQGRWVIEDVVMDIATALGVHVILKGELK